MPGVTQAEFARMVGVSRPAVHKAVVSGRIRCGEDGLIDPEQGLRDWRQDRVYGRGTPPLKPEAHAAAKRLPPTPVQQPARPAAAPLAKPRQDAPDPGDGAEGPTMVRLQKAELGLKLEERKLRIDREKGRLIDKAKAVAMVQRLAQEERDAILNWPIRISAILAAELGADPHRVQTLLEGSLRDHLAARGDFTARLG